MGTPVEEWVFSGWLYDPALRVRVSPADYFYVLDELYGGEEPDMRPEREPGFVERQTLGWHV